MSWLIRGQESKHQQCKNIGAVFKPDHWWSISRGTAKGGPVGLCCRVPRFIHNLWCCCLPISWVWGVQHVNQASQRKANGRIWLVHWRRSYFSALQSSRKFDSESSVARILFGELTRKDFSKKMDTGEEFRILSFDFSFTISFLRL